MLAVASVILFTGSEGIAAVERFQNPEWGRVNFLVRNRRRFVEHGFLVAVVDVPSDHTTGYGWSRTSKTHAQDVAGVIAALRREALVPVWVVGTSMGTISAANAAARLRVGGPDGLVLTSSVTRRSVITRLGITVRDGESAGRSARRSGLRDGRRRAPDPAADGGRSARPGGHGSR